MSSGDRPPSARALARALRRLPVFPLPDVVLFPHALLPLHVFEPRYRQLTRDVLASHKLVGVPLLVEQEVAGAAPPHFATVFGVGEVMMAQELPRSEEHTSELQSPCNLVCRLLLEKK